MSALTESEIKKKIFEEQGYRADVIPGSPSTYNGPKMNFKYDLANTWNSLQPPRPPLDVDVGVALMNVNEVKTKESTVIENSSM